MIEKMMISNDKSIVGVYPTNLQLWFRLINSNFSKNDERYYFYLKMTKWRIIFSKIMLKFYDYMKHCCSACKEQKNYTTKYKLFFVFRYFSIEQSRQHFGFFIYFNYIQYMNDCGFNHITKNTRLEETLFMIEEIKRFYIEQLKDFIERYRENFKVLIGKEEYPKSMLKEFEIYIINSLNKSTNINWLNLSLTADIHFKKEKYKRFVFNDLERIKKENYKTFIIPKETVYFNPTNIHLLKFDKRNPKIRFYDKSKDLLKVYTDKSQKHKLKITTRIKYEDGENDEIFHFIDSNSLKSKELENAFLKALNFLQNKVIRFEVEFSREALRKHFNWKKDMDEKEKSKYKSISITNVYHLNISNEKVIYDFLNKVLDQESVTYNKIVYSEQIWDKTKNRVITKPIKVVKFENYKVNEFTQEFQFNDAYNFVLKNQDFLNDLDKIELYKKELSTLPSFLTQSKNAIYEKIRRFREAGVIRGRGKNIIINHPYCYLLDMINHTDVIREISPKKLSNPSAS